MLIDEYNNAKKIFIIGVPKCGTTSLYNFLLRKNLVIPHSRKEPHYFASDLDYDRFNTLQSYVDGFQVGSENSNKKHPLIDASVWYLYSDLALQQISDLQGDKRIIIMFREPSSMIKSLFDYNVLKGYEKRDNFIKSLRSSISDNDPDWTFSWHSTDYRRAISFRKRIEQAIEIFNENLLLIDMQEFVSGHPQTIKSLEAFLEIDLKPYSELTVPHENKKRTSRSDTVSKFIYRWRYHKNLSCIREIYHFFKKYTKFDLLKIIKIINEKPGKLELSMDEVKLLNQIQEQYSADYEVVKKLQQKSQLNFLK